MPRNSSPGRDANGPPGAWEDQIGAVRADQENALLRAFYSDAAIGPRCNDMSATVPQSGRTCCW
jgi:hypothetical protein